VTGALPGLVCVKIDGKPPSSSWRSWLGFTKLLQLLESWPW
jgi:hypothetical protein